MKANSIVITLVVALVVAAGAFYGGMKYQSGKASANQQFTRGTNGTTNGNRGRFGGQNGNAVRGDIISNDNNTITVKLSDGTTKIVVLGNNTMINKTSPAQSSDLKSGVTVVAFGTTNSDGSITAQNIQINPEVRPSPAQ